MIRDIALTLSNLGDVKLRTGDATGAMANYEQALANIRRLSDHDSDQYAVAAGYDRNAEQAGRRKIADRRYPPLRQRAMTSR